MKSGLFLFDKWYQPLVSYQRLCVRLTQPWRHVVCLVCVSVYTATVDCSVRTKKCCRILSFSCCISNLPFPVSTKLWSDSYEDMIDHHSYACNLSSCEIRAWIKFRPIPVQCSTNWAIKAIGRWPLFCWPLCVCVVVFAVQMCVACMQDLVSKFSAALSFGFKRVCSQTMSNLTVTVSQESLFVTNVDPRGLRDAISQGCLRHETDDSKESLWHILTLE